MKCCHLTTVSSTQSKFFTLPSIGYIYINIKNTHLLILTAILKYSKYKIEHTHTSRPLLSLRFRADLHIVYVMADKFVRPSVTKLLTKHLFALRWINFHRNGNFARGTSIVRRLYGVSRRRYENLSADIRITHACP